VQLVRSGEVGIDQRAEPASLHVGELGLVGRCRAGFSIGHCLLLP
jgi:hypothetical protein